MKQLKITHKLAAALTAGLMTGGSISAHAATADFTTLTTNINQSTSTLPNLISTVSYIGGIGLGVAGIFKLKQHVESPAQHTMKDGLVRLGAGGGLLVLPFITEMMMSTISAGAAGAGANVAETSFATAPLP